MKKLALVSIITLLGAFSLVGTGIKRVGATDNTIIPQASSPVACQADRKDREPCNRWYELTEDPDPTAWLYDRRNLEAPARWYHVGQAKPKLAAKKIVIDKMIHFDFNKYNIKADSYGILDDVASIIKANPQIKKIQVEGNTDAIGSEAYNMKLSQRRAESVVNYLTNKGVPSNVLVPIGYGKTRPIATNKTAAGRAQNRRVEFNVVDQ